jgi:ketosteroid isomerase-like protein
MAQKSLEPEVARYDAGAVAAGNAMPRARGIAEIRAMLKNIFADPNFALTWKTEKVVIGASGAIAYSSGAPSATAARPARISPCGASSAMATGNC